MSQWSFDNFWNKAVSYVKKAQGVGPKDPMFPFSSSLAFEVLAKATLAYKHPILVADVKTSDASLFYALDMSIKEIPKTATMNVIISRCKFMMPKEFSDYDKSGCALLTSKRNAELHGDEFAFEGFETKLWLTDYYLFCKTLLSKQNKKLVDLFGEDEADAAEKQINKADKDFISYIKVTIDNVQKTFEALDLTEQTKRKEAGSRTAKSGISNIHEPWNKTIECPACKAQAIIYGKAISVSLPKEKYGEFVQVHTVMPLKFQCFSCELQLPDYKSLQASNLGELYSIELPNNYERFVEEYLEAEAFDYYANLKNEG